MREPLETSIADNPRPFWSVALFGQMMRDLSQCSGYTDPVEQVCYLLDTLYHKFMQLTHPTNFEHMTNMLSLLSVAGARGGANSKTEFLYICSHYYKHSPQN